MKGCTMLEIPERAANLEGNFYEQSLRLKQDRSPDSKVEKAGLNPRVQRLREKSYQAKPSLAIERAIHQTEFYQQNNGKHSVPIMRALSFLDHCQRKTLYFDADELIVGERGPAPKAVPTFPELTCHSVEDFHVLNQRDQQPYTISQQDIDIYERDIIPYWQGRTQRERIFSQVSQEWRAAYEAACFTEFMEQRAPGHTALDGKIYNKGLLDHKKEIADHLARLDYKTDPQANDKTEQLKAMDISCDAVILFAQRHADLLDQQAAQTDDSDKAVELRNTADMCREVPANAPKTFHQAVQMYWFCHLATITELNGWDAMNPGHFDQHLTPFYQREVAAGTLTREKAKEILSCFWIKVNNHTAPPKVGITAKESGTYNDFTNINLGGLKKDGSDGVSEVSYIMLELVEDIHLLQPGTSVHISTKTPDKFLLAACKVIRQGHGYPSVFNPDIYIQEMLRSGKSLEDAREGGCSGCIEVGAFGKEAFVLTGYLNVPKILEVTLNNGIDPQTGKKVGLETGAVNSFNDYNQLYDAFQHQLAYIIDMKIRVSNFIDTMFAKYAPAPFLSVLIDDCIAKGRDYYNSGPRYNTNYIQCCGLATATDSLLALKKHVFEDARFTMDAVLTAVSNNFDGEEIMRQTILNKTPFYGNNLDYADQVGVKLYDDLIDLIDGQPNIKTDGKYHLNMLSTTCHVYFGKMMGATPNGRMARKSISDGTSPSHGSDRRGPSAVIKSLGKLDQIKSGGTLLNLRFLPSLLKRDEDLKKLGSLVRSYFVQGGHHIQFNIVDSATLRAAQETPEDYKDLLVRMAGYSDYFNDMNGDLQQEVIDRTENENL